MTSDQRIFDAVVDTLTNVKREDNFPEWMAGAVVELVRSERDGPFDRDTWPPVRTEEEWQRLAVADHREISTMAMVIELGILADLERHFDKLATRLEQGDL